MFLVALLVALSLSAAPALAARGHVFSGSFGGPCLVEPCEGLLKEPAGVAVNEASGDVFVVDKGTNRVARFSATGVYEAQFKGPSATGTGTLTSGSVTVEAAVAVTGAFSVGEEVSAPGLPAGTTITAVKGEVLTVSGPAAKSGSEPLTAQQSFSAPEGIAVDNACVRHKPVLTEATTPTCKAFDATAGDVYVLDAGNSVVVDRFTAAGVYLGQLTGTFREPPASKEFEEEHVFRELHGVATDASGNVWVAASWFGGEEGAVDEFTGTQFVKHVDVSIIGFMGRGLGVDAASELYVHGNGLVKKFSSGGVLLNGEVDHGVVGVTSGVGVELSSGDVYVDEGAGVSRFDSAGVLLEHLQVPGGAGGDLAVSDVSESLYVAEPGGGVVDVFGPEPPGPPSVQAPSVTDVTATSAELGGEVNPHGAPTTARVEYGRCESVEQCSLAGFGESLPEGSGVVGSDFELTVVAAHASDLLPGSVYHFRLVVVNIDGEATGEERVFSTQPGAGRGPVPADGRQWQLVSPPDKHGAQLQPSFSATQASLDGGAMSYVAVGPTEVGTPGNSRFVQLISHRTSAGWVSKDIVTPHEQAVGLPLGEGLEYRLFSSDLSVAVVQPQPPFTSPSSSELTAFLRFDLGAGEVCGVTCYRPLVTGCPPPGQACPPSVREAANVPAGTVFGGGEQSAATTRRDVTPYFRGATPDLSHVVFQSNVALTEGAGAAGGLYLWSGGRLALIGNAGGEGAFDAISTDGSRVVFSEGEPGGLGIPLLLRDMARGEALLLDTVEGGTGEGPAIPEFQFATPDASTVLFTDTRQLTASSRAAGGNPDLYGCRVVIRAGKLACNLTDLTPSGGEPADVLGHVLGASSDGSTVYFVANGVLAPGAVHGNCVPGFFAPQPPGAQCNLYASREGTTTLVTILSGEDFPAWAQRRPQQPTAVSSSGAWLTFMSQASIPTAAFPHGYDNRDAVSGVRDEEVYLYHAGGGVVCVSCLPSGARPHGVEYKKLDVAEGNGLAGGFRVWRPNEWLAGNVPSWTGYVEDEAVYHSRFLNDSGRLFFNSSDGLVSSDGNGNEDVYQFEPVGVGACRTASVAYSPAVAGCVGLISSGKDANESAFMDASESGGDVFFLTSARLSKADTDTSVDMYDAHECTTGSPCLPTPVETPPSCSSGDSCKPAPSLQPDIFGPGASQTFSGSGNVISEPLARVVKSKRCKKGLVEKHNRCVPSRRRRHKRTNGKRGR